MYNEVQNQINQLREKMKEEVFDQAFKQAFRQTFRRIFNVVVIFTQATEEIHGELDKQHNKLSARQAQGFDQDVVSYISS